MRFNQWWLNDPSERYWLEITDRGDLGIDLNAPQTGVNGREQWHYSLIGEVQDGDIVFHYHRAGGEPAISAWSKASGTVRVDEVVWAPHAGGPKEPERQPGWRLALEGFHPVEPPVTFTELRNGEEMIRVLETELTERYGTPLYTPFEIGNRPIRPKQAYLTKLPADLVAAFPSLWRAAEIAKLDLRVEPSPVPNPILGEIYRRPDEGVMVAESDPFDRDPALVERALRSHAATQNALADFLSERGIEPRSSNAVEPSFDLAWLDGGHLTVVEVKSIRAENEERQLRLALGQVLRYRHLLKNGHRAVSAAIVTSERPTDDSWGELLRSHDVTLSWPGNFDNLLKPTLA